MTPDAWKSEILKHASGRTTDHVSLISLDDISSRPSLIPAGEVLPSKSKRSVMLRDACINRTMALIIEQDMMPLKTQPDSSWGSATIKKQEQRPAAWCMHKSYNGIDNRERY